MKFGITKTDTNYNRLKRFQCMQQCCGDMTIDWSASDSLHSYFSVTSVPDRLPTGYFLGYHCRIWGADLRSHSVSWHDRFHSGCYEWPLSNPGGETWETDTVVARVKSIQQKSKIEYILNVYVENLVWLLLICHNNQYHQHHYNNLNLQEQ